jgi:heme exporter protein D
MMPDLGKYAVEVTSAYVVSLALILALAAWYWARGRAVRRQLHDVEIRKGKNV